MPTRGAKVLGFRDQFWSIIATCMYRKGSDWVARLQQANRLDAGDGIAADPAGGDE